MKHAFMLTCAAMALMSACSQMVEQGASPETVVKSSITACDGYATALQGLADFRAAGRLASDQIAAVDNVRPKISAICDGPYPADPAAAETQVRQATDLLKAIAVEVH